MNNLLSPEKQYLRSDDLTLEFGLLQNNKRFLSYIQLVTKLPKQWDRDKIRTRVTNSLEQLKMYEPFLMSSQTSVRLTVIWWKKVHNYHLNSKLKWSSELKLTKEYCIPIGIQRHD